MKRYSHSLKTAGLLPEM